MPVPGLGVVSGGQRPTLCAHSQAGWEGCVTPGAPAQAESLCASVCPAVLHDWGAGQGRLGDPTYPRQAGPCRCHPAHWWLQEPLQHYFP